MLDRWFVVHSFGMLKDLGEEEFDGQEANQFILKQSSHENGKRAGRHESRSFHDGVQMDIPQTHCQPIGMPRSGRM